MRPPAPPSIITTGVARERAARTRFAAALACSVLVHALVSTGSTGGGGRNIQPAASKPSVPLDARLAMPSPELPIIEPAPEPHPTVRVEAPSRAIRPVARPPAQAEALRAPGDATPTALSDSTYYGARQLDVYPVLTSRLALAAPAGPAAQHAPARVLLLVLIDAEGVVNEATVIEAEPRDIFEERARAAFTSARFRPAMKAGRAVKSRLLIEVDFSETAVR